MEAQMDVIEILLVTVVLVGVFCGMFAVGCAISDALDRLPRMPGRHRRE